MNKTSSIALILIAVALLGAGVSYHLTLDSRFASIEQKLDQNTIAMQQFEIAQETLTTKAETLNTLNKEVENLQTSLAPLGKATREQTDSLDDMHKQIASLEAAAQTQQDAQKKLADYAAQLDKIKHDIASASQPVLVAPVSHVVPAPVTAPAETPITVSAPAPAPRRWCRFCSRTPRRRTSFFPLHPAPKAPWISAPTRRPPWRTNRRCAPSPWPCRLRLRCRSARPSIFRGRMDATRIVGIQLACF